MNSYNAPSFQFSSSMILPTTTIYKFDAVNNHYKQIETVNNDLPQRIKIAQRRSNFLQCDIVLESYELGKWKLFTGLQIVDNGPSAIGNRVVIYDEKKQKITEALQAVITPDKEQLFLYTFGGDVPTAIERMNLGRAFVHYLEIYGTV